MDNVNKKVDIIVAGAGPAGVSAAITAAKAGKKVLLVERGDFAGSKNVFGGAIYYKQTNEIFPDFLNSAPIERIVNQQRIYMLKDDSSLQVSYSYPEKDKAVIVKRAKWDKWCVEEAVKQGVLFAPKTLITGCVKENGRVVGIKTEQEEYYSDVLIIADGVNSLLAKQLGMRKELKDKDVTLNVKEVIQLPQQRLEDRFNLDSNSGIAAKILGGPLKDMFALGFMYTYKDAVSIGFGISLDELKTSGLSPEIMLENLKSHPAVASVIKDGKTIEYSAHMIPEGTFDCIPKVYGGGVLIAGDAAMFVNNIHMEGTNLAMLSGKLAAESAVYAVDKHDFSAETLSVYEKKLKNSIIFKDLKTHNNTIRVIKRNIKTITSLYPELGCEFFKVITEAGGIPKSKTYKDFLFKIIKSGAVIKSIPLALFALEKCLKK